MKHKAFSLLVLLALLLGLAACSGKATPTPSPTDPMQTFEQGEKTMNMKKKLFLLILALTLLLSGCGQPYVYQMPEELDDGWETAGLEKVGINESLIAKAVKRIGYNTYPNVHSLLIVKDGKLVFKEYFGGYEWVYDSDREV